MRSAAYQGPQFPDPAATAGLRRRREERGLPVTQRAAELPTPSRRVGDPKPREVVR